MKWYNDFADLIISFCKWLVTGTLEGANFQRSIYFSGYTWLQLVTVAVTVKNLDFTGKLRLTRLNSHLLEYFNFSMHFYYIQCIKRKIYSSRCFNRNHV